MRLVIAYFFLCFFSVGLLLNSKALADEISSQSIQAAHAWSYQKVAVDWREVPLLMGVRRLMATQSFASQPVGKPSLETPHLAVHIDRRIDPAMPLTLASRGTANVVFEAAATSLQLDFLAIQQLGYFMPAGCSRQLEQTLVKNREEVIALPRRWRQRYEKRAPIEWEDLAEPRQLVASMLGDRQIKIDGLDLVPHDVWLAGRWPSLAMGDQLTLLLFGFDLEWIPQNRGAAVLIRPITASRAEVSRRPSVAEAPKSTRSPTTPADRSSQRFTLRVEQKTVGALLKALAGRLDMKFELPQEADASTAAKLQQKISFEVDQATFAELLEAIERKSGVAIEQVGNVLSIRQ